MTRLLPPCFIVFIGLALPASAMNWEGHDDWTDTFAPGLLLEMAAPNAKPLPDHVCPVTPEMLATNPYEQIPLPRHGCKQPVHATEPRH
jgi:hypothetical protein